MTTDETPSTPAAATEERVITKPRRKVRAGFVALVASAFLVLWVFLVAYLALLGSSGGNDVAAGIAYVLFFASFLVVPVLIVMILVMAIIALALNAVPGKIMGAVAIVLPIIVGVLFLGSIFDLPSLFSVVD